MGKIALVEKGIASSVSKPYRPKRKHVEELSSKVPASKRPRKSRSLTDDAPTESFTGQPLGAKTKAEASTTPKKHTRVPRAEVASSSERRLKRFRKQPPQAFLDKLNRAQTQRMYVIDRTRSISTISKPSAPLAESKKVIHDQDEPLAETVLLAGTTGNVYTVAITTIPTCTCPDFSKNKSQCKHIIYVLAIVLKAREDLVYQLAFLKNELVEILEAAPLPSSKPRCSEEAERDKRKPLEGDCPICFMPMEPASDDGFLWCKAACGQNVHRECFEQWAKSSMAFNKKVQCVYCRAEWEGNEDSVARILKAGGGHKGREGYINVGEQLGLDKRRDYSTYHQFWLRKQRRLGLLQDVDEGGAYD